MEGKVLGIARRLDLFFFRTNAARSTGPPTKPRLAGSGTAAAVTVNVPFVRVSMGMLAPTPSDSEVTAGDNVIVNSPVAAAPAIE